MWVKRYQNGTLVSVNMDQNPRKPSCLILSHSLNRRFPHPLGPKRIPIFEVASVPFGSCPPKKRKEKDRKNKKGNKPMSVRAGFPVGVFGFWMPQTGDSVWGHICASGKLSDSAATTIWVPTRQAEAEQVIRSNRRLRSLPDCVTKYRPAENPDGAHGTASLASNKRT